MTMEQTMEQLSKFLVQSKPLAEKYGKKAEYDSLSAILEQGGKKELTLLVCGEFKRGKSSFINALLGQELCPVADGIATSTVSIISYYGEGKAKATRHYSTLVKNKEGKEELSMKEEEIDIEKIAKFAKGTSNEIGDTMFIEIKTPNPVLKDGLVLIDTPGVGSLDPRHLFLTLQALPKADAFLYVTDTGEPLTFTELDFIKERLVPTGKPFDLLISKSDKVSRENLARYVNDTEKKVKEECGVEARCIPVSSTEWKSFNETGIERRRANSNCEAVYAAIDSLRTRREQLYAQRFKEQFAAYMEGIKQQASEALDAAQNGTNDEVLELKNRLEGLKALEDMVKKENSDFRRNISKIIEDSQDKVMQDFSRDSVLLSSEKLDEILNNPKATAKGGEEYVTNEVNKAIKELSENLDKQINRAMGDVMAELQQFIKSVKLEQTSFNGTIQACLEPLLHSFSENFVNMTRAALPFLGVTTIGSAVSAFGLGLGAGLFGAGAAAFTPLAVVAGAIGVAAGIYYVVQSIKGAKKMEKIAHFKKQISPRISIAMNELRLYIQKRYSALQKEVVNALRTAVDDMTRQMQEIVRLIQECQQDNQKKVQRTKEIEGELKLAETLATQVKVLGTNPFAKK